MIPFDFIESSASLETQGFIKLCSSPTTHQFNFSQYLTKSKKLYEAFILLALQSFCCLSASHIISIQPRIVGGYLGVQHIPLFIFYSKHPPKMARITKILLDTEIRQSKPKEKDYKLMDGKSLFLLVRSSGAKIWRFTYTKPLTDK